MPTDPVTVRKLIGEQVSLAVPRRADVEAWTRWMNDLDVVLPLGYEAYYPVTEEALARQIGDVAEKRDHVFTIVENGTGRSIGQAQFFAVDAVNRCGRIGMMIGEKELWGRGYGAAALRLLLDHAFDLLNLNSVDLEVYAFNTRALRCYRRAGFREIGRRRARRLIAGVYHDSVLMDLLAEEHRATRRYSAVPDVVH